VSLENKGPLSSTPALRSSSRVDCFSQHLPSSRSRSLLSLDREYKNSSPGRSLSLVAIASSSTHLLRAPARQFSRHMGLCQQKPGRASEREEPAVRARRGRAPVCLPLVRRDSHDKGLREPHATVCIRYPQRYAVGRLPRKERGRATRIAHAAKSKPQCCGWGTSSAEVVDNLSAGWRGGKASAETFRAYLASNVLDIDLWGIRHCRKSCE